ncbi:hypothetical protein QQS21_006450 [Conoideocrella luteorostrata]|uniref:Acyl-CoA thioesterase-like C-terminal domain-containing protein n=1 Tax=Conoideocrella luteorostrata TaxID=1105319 RepID=A0AAJ0CMI2_9HYPO|nr:hypothetical protein QQS21_006450 [Conoideocrella luteorostrata]
MTNSKDISLAGSIKVEKLDSHTYKANLNELFGIGAVPNGGYTASCMLAAASTHLASRKQTDTFTTHLEYLNRTSPGVAIITVEDTKLGKQVSTLHLTLWQGNGLLQQAPWVTPGVTRRKGPLQPGVMDLWLCLASGESITQATLPYVTDSFPYNMHLFLVAPELRAMLETPAPNKSEDKETTNRRAETLKKNEDRAGMWFPTLVMNLENKTALPEEGVKWLNTRITSKQINNGKFDLDVIIRDTDGELVALSHHVAMVLSMARNTGKSSL